MSTISSDITRSQAQQQYIGRTREEMARFFTGLDLIDPGIVRVEQWHPDPNPGETGDSTLWCAVGRKPQ